MTKPKPDVKIRRVENVVTLECRQSTEYAAMEFFDKILAQAEIGDVHIVLE